MDDIKNISLKEFNQNPDKVERITSGLQNEVYAVRVKDKDYIFRLNKKPEPLQGSSKYIPVFKSLGIKVPDIVVENYSNDISQYNYQIQTLLKGAEINDVIEGLTKDQLESIAFEIANIAKKLLQQPTNGKYGYVGVSESKLKLSWNEYIKEMLETIKDRTSKTKVVDSKYIEIFEGIMQKYSDYFSNVPSQFYFDDMNSKNVIIDNGVFNGIVDLDVVSYGDYLEGIGKIKASWYGTEYGDIYTNAVMKDLSLSEEQRKMVTVYALLNRIYWLSENGVQFNQNTSADIDLEKVRESKVIIDDLIKELNV